LDQRCGPAPWQGGAVRARLRCARNDAVLTPRQPFVFTIMPSRSSTETFATMEKTLERQTAIRCTECNGRGVVWRDPSKWRTLACPTCDGKGVRMWIDQTNDEPVLVLSRPLRAWLRSLLPRARQAASDALPDHRVLELGEHARLLCGTLPRKPASEEQPRHSDRIRVVDSRLVRTGPIQHAAEPQRKRVCFRHDVTPNKKQWAPEMDRAGRAESRPGRAVTTARPS
jgi:hypothetical protein